MITLRIFFLTTTLLCLNISLLEQCMQKNAPNIITTLHQKALHLHEQEQYTQALELLSLAEKQDPGNIVTQLYRASTLLYAGNITESLAVYENIIQQEPNNLIAIYNKGFALKTNGNLDAAIEMYHKALQLNPEYDPAHLALGFAYLAQGNFKKGWKQHERYLIKSKKNSPELKKLITTNTLAGKKILLTYEGGLGDTLQFIRYAKRLKNHNAIVHVLVQKPLESIISLCPYIDFVYTQIPHNTKYNAIASLMSLPAIFEDTELTFPKEFPYIQTNSEIIDSWKDSFDHSYFNVGICWQASIHNDKSRLPIARRGIPLALLSHLNQPRIRFYSLQQKEGLEQINELPHNFPIIFFDSTFDSSHGPFIDTAAVMTHLDLIITVDTAVAHLAGALARPVWLLLPYATDWRWIHERKDSPWYPTMRIFKQQHPFDWESVITQVKKELFL